ncbi:MAG: SDR family NAD(P)-dependent oxidoreductase [bacterium]|nr:SDR family NAD(P)-dependent oxidoreductase [bacterium]
MSANEKSILITGANGFVGSRLCRRFLDQGYRVVAGVRPTADLKLLDDLKIEYRHGDVTQPETLPDMVRGVDYIVHNAGIVKAKKQDTYFAVNERGTRSLCEAVVEHNPDVQKTVFISSVAVAGPSTEGRPLKETDPPNPITTYGRSKLAGEQVALSFADRLPVAVIRPPGVYGPGDKEIFAIFQAVYRHIRPLIGDVNRRMQLVHVDDLTLGVSKAVAASIDSGDIFFIAEGSSYTLTDMIGMLESGCGKKGIPLVLPAPLFRLIAAVSEFSFRLVGATPMLTREKSRELNASWEVDVSRAREILGYESQIPFAEGARQTFDWYKKEGWL